MKFKKVYVTMIVKITKDGSLRPLSMVWEDGATYEIDRVLHITPAASLKVGGCGTRYTVMIEGKQRDLYDEDGSGSSRRKCLHKQWEVTNEPI